MDRQLSHSSSVDEASEASVKSDGSRQGSFSAPPAGCFLIKNEMPSA